MIIQAATIALKFVEGNCDPGRKPYYEQHFLVSAGVDCDLEATLYTRISNRKILTWIQRITGESLLAV